MCNLQLSSAWGEKVAQFRPAVISRVASLCGGQAPIKTDPRDHTAPRFRAWDARAASVATGPTALPTRRVMIFATIAITVGGISRVIATFRARASRPAAQESPRRPVGACEIVETIPDHVNFISPSSGVYMGGVRYFLSNETIFI